MRCFKEQRSAVTVGEQPGVQDFVQTIPFAYFLHQLFETHKIGHHIIKTKTTVRVKKNTKKSQRSSLLTTNNNSNGASGWNVNQMAFSLRNALFVIDSSSSCQSKKSWFVSLSDWSRILKRFFITAWMNTGSVRNKSGEPHLRRSGNPDTGLKFWNCSQQNVNV